MNLKLLKSYRDFEIQKVLGQMASKAPSLTTVLEIGAGAGWQARCLQEYGYDVTAIDIESSIYKDHKVFPVFFYDGKMIPFPVETFELVFTSNVIAHVVNLHTFHQESSRVLEQKGKAIHVVPSSTWRFWTNLTYYPTLLRTLTKRIIEMLHEKTTDYSGDSHPPKRINSSHIPLNRPHIVKHVVPSALGVRGNAASEMWNFSRWGWAAHFSRTGWRVQRRFGSSLFYTGYMVLGTRISLRSRETLSKLLGSSCHIFFLKKASPVDPD